MDAAENDNDAVRRLRRTMRDLVALSTLSGAWAGLEPENISNRLAKVLSGTLDLDLVYIRLAQPNSSGFTEAICSKHHPDADRCIYEVRDWLPSLLTDAASIPVAIVPDPLGTGTLRMTLTRFGLEERDVLVTGSQRAGFPTEEDRLLLELAASQVVVVARQQRAEQALQQSEERFRGFANAAPAMLWVTEPDGFCSFLSQGWYEFTGQDEDEGLGFGWLNAVHPEDREEASKNFLLANERNEEFFVEYRLRRADGMYRWIIDAGRPRFSPEGKFLGYAGNLLDITDRKQVEKDLQESREHLRAIFESVGDGLYVMGPDARCTYLNPAGAAMLGYQAQELVGRHLHNIIHHTHPDGPHRAVSESPVALAVREGVPARVDDDVFWRKDGSPIPVTYSVSPILVDGRPTGAVVAYRDVTERKQSEEEMAALLGTEKCRAALLAQVANASKSMNVEWSVDSIARILTEEARSMLGAHQAVTSVTISENWAQTIRAVSLSDKYAHYHAYSEKPDGSGIYMEVCRTNRPMRMTQQELEAHPAWKGFGKHAKDHPPMRGWLAVPLIGHGGKNLGLVQLTDKAQGEFTEEDEAILVQLAAIASTGIENAYLYEQVRKQDRRKDEFLATLAHELRNPLAPVRNGLAVLKLAPSMEATVRIREIMERQVEHMVRLIDDLLDVSRITSGKIQLKKERVDVRTVLDAALELSRPLIEENQHRLFIPSPKESLLLHVDPTRMAQVVSNLLNNAAKYTSKGGRIELSAERDGSEVIIRVRDNGVGLTSESLPEVFELFSQVGKTLDRSRGGLGIGLALVKRLVEMHNGSIAAESKGLGQGSTFVVRLPLAATQIIKRQVAGAGDYCSLSVPRRILVVDDNVDGAETLAMLLMMSGHTVETAHTGPDALKAAQTFQPDVMFLDIGLPGLSGYEVAQQLRSDPNINGLILVALTGWGSEEDRRRARTAGFDYHLTKPVEIEKLRWLLCEIDQELTQSLRLRP
ncbi:MAG TPA: PAS domain S-box protein [Nitrosospira sp.]|nr:PAS domain S-box protein [Nitrosospira sp.]